MYTCSRCGDDVMSTDPGNSLCPCCATTICQSAGIYLATVRRLDRRYTVDGAITISVGGIPTKYSRLVAMAWQRHIDRV